MNAANEEMKAEMRWMQNAAERMGSIGSRIMEFGTGSAEKDIGHAIDIMARTLDGTISRMGTYLGTYGGDEHDLVVEQTPASPYIDTPSTQFAFFGTTATLVAKIQRGGLLSDAATPESFVKAVSECTDESLLRDMVDYTGTQIPGITPAVAKAARIREEYLRNIRRERAAWASKNRG